ncbi:hypothetical protein LMANV2_330081 [Leptospira interrogans serovar Manilae]|uniref:Uncharacterized protein n=1 Tax=Leptospira interrogans serovar Manilae TaxID=214675 RepID=A0AAQ1NXW3_LEPIR|nr:hypothetical protein LMANV2_330081 [Leptospira interrogans serovar Manilae]
MYLTGASRFENLISIYKDLVNSRIHPIIRATWFHHTFTIIYPF